MTLESILAQMEQAAGLTKQAETDDEAHEKAEDKEHESAKKNLEEAREGIEKATEDVEDAQEVNDEKEHSKEARLQGAALAQEVMSKVASLNLTPEINKEPEMRKEAAAAGKALADALLEKLAAAGDANTDNGVVEDTVPQKNIVDSAQMVAEDDSKIKPMPTGDGIRNDGTINQILDGIIADAVAQGAAAHGGNVEAMAGHSSDVEGDVEDHAVPHQEPTDEQEKAAAVSVLVQDGFDFDSAVEMVKAAAEEIEAEETLQIKQAALGALMDRGVDFDTAVEMVKQANALIPAGPLRQVGRGMSNRAKMAIGAGMAGAAGAATALAMRRRGQEKKAALDALVESGVDFDSAVHLVESKAAELYGN